MENKGRNICMDMGIHSRSHSTSLKGGEPLLSVLRYSVDLFSDTKTSTCVVLVIRKRRKNCCDRF